MLATPIFLFCVVSSGSVTAVVRLINFLKLLPSSSFPPSFSFSLISYIGSIANYRTEDCDNGILSKQPRS